MKLALTSMLGLLLFVLLPACSDASDNSSQKPVATPVPMKKLPAAPKFEILEEKDVSIAGAKRLTVSVLIEKRPVSSEEIESVSRTIFTNKSGAKLDEVTVWYYFDRTQFPGSFTLAMAEWKTNGDWSDASRGSTKNVNHKFTRHVGQIIEGAPTPEERRIRKRMKELFAETGGKTDEELAKILSPELNKTPKEIVEINNKVALYDMDR